MPALALTEEERRSALAELDAADAAEPQFNVASLAPEEKSAAIAELDAADKAAQTAQPESYDERVARLGAQNTPVVPPSTYTSSNPVNVLSWEKPYVPGEGESGIVQKAGNFVGNLARGAAPVVAGAALGTAAEGGIPGPGTIAGGAAGALAGNLAEQARNEKVKAFHAESNVGPRSLVQKFKEEPVKSITSAVVDTAMGALQLKTADTLRRSTLEAVRQFGRSPEARKAIAKEIAVNLGVDVTTGNVQAGTQYLIDGGDPGSREFLDLMLESTATNAVVSGAGAYMTNRGHKTQVANEAAQEAARMGAEHPTGRSGPEVFWRRQQPVAGAPESVAPPVEVRPDGTLVNPALRSKLAPEEQVPEVIESPAGAARQSVEEAPAIPSATQAPESTPIAQPQPESATKQPWEMTRDEFAQQGGEISYSAEQGTGSHRDVVEEAFARGEKLSPEVLKDYPWIAADIAIRPYVDNLKNLSDKELRAEEKRAAAELNKWAHDTPAILSEGEDWALNPGLQSQAGFEISNKFNAVGNEIDARKVKAESAAPQGFIESRRAREASAPAVVEQPQPKADAPGQPPQDALSPETVEPVATEPPKPPPNTTHARIVDPEDVPAVRAQNKSMKAVNEYLGVMEGSDFVSPDRKHNIESLNNALGKGYDHTAGTRAQAAILEGRMLNDEETAGLVYRMSEVADLYEKEMVKLEKAHPDSDAAMRHWEELAALEQELHLLEAGSNASGTEVARAMQIRKIGLLDRGLKIAPYLQKLRRESGNAELDPSLREWATEKVKRYEEQDKLIKELQEKAKKLEADLALKRRREGHAQPGRERRQLTPEQEKALSDKIDRLLQAGCTVIANG